MGDIAHRSMGRRGENEKTKGGERGHVAMGAGGGGEAKGGDTRIGPFHGGGARPQLPVGRVCGRILIAGLWSGGRRVGLTVGRTDGCTDGRTAIGRSYGHSDGRSDGQTV